jgi:hypothetical protein
MTGGCFGGAFTWCSTENLLCKAFCILSNKEELKNGVTHFLHRSSCTNLSLVLS